MYRTNNQVPSNDMRDLSDNAEILDQIVNSPEPTVKNRLGKSVKTAKGIADDIQAVLKTGNVASVNGKKGAVELTPKDIGAVDAEQITAVLQREMHRNIYVDNINGSDINNNGYSRDKPCKTFSHAFKQMVPGGTYYIRLLSDYIFTADEPRAEAFNNNVLIRSDSVDDKKRIKFAYSVSKINPLDFSINGFIFRGSCGIELLGLNLELPDVPTEHKKGKRYSYWASCFISEWGNRNSIQLGVRLVSSEVIAPNPEINGFNLIGNPGGMTSLVLAGAKFPAAWRDRNKVFADMWSKDISVTRCLVTHQSAFNPNPNTHNNQEVQ